MFSEEFLSGGILYLTLCTLLRSWNGGMIVCRHGNLPYLVSHRWMLETSQRFLFDLYYTTIKRLVLTRSLDPQYQQQPAPHNARPRPADAHERGASVGVAREGDGAAHG